MDAQTAITFPFQRRWNRIRYWFKFCSVGCVSAAVICLLLAASQLNRKSIRLFSSSSSSAVSVTNAGEYVVFESSPTDGRGLGNKIFSFAAAVYVSQLSRRRVVHLERGRNRQGLGEVFDLTDLELADDDVDVCPCFRFREEKSLAYDARIERMARFDNPDTRNRSIFLDGYFQSWKYTRSVENRLRNHLVFLPDRLDYVDAFFARTAPKSWKKGFIRVGIHVRRGDVASESAAKIGYSVPDETYFQKAMQYLVALHERVQFVVCSDDLNWCRGHITLAPFNRSNVDVTFCEGRRREEDFAILSNCDHVIMSTGTLGWWAAWIANGLTIFYSNWPLVNTYLYSAFKYDDFFPLAWISME